MKISKSILQLKSIFLAAITFVFFACANAQGQYVQGNDAQTGGGGLCQYVYGPAGYYQACINWWFPTVQANQNFANQTDILPGSFNYQFAYAPVTATVYDTLTTAFNYFKKDTVVGGTVFNFNVDSHVSGGSFLCLQLGGGSDSARVVYVNQGATPVDTVTVTNHRLHRLYVFDGTQLQPAYK